MEARVDPLTGRVLVTCCDVVVPAASMPRWHRRYDSALAWRAGAFGPGWSQPFEESLRPERGGMIWQLADGRERALRGGGFERDERTGRLVVRAGSATRSFVPPAADRPGPLERVVTERGAWTIHHAPREDRFRDPSGWEIVLERDAGGRPHRLSAGASGALTVVRRYEHAGEVLVAVHDEQGLLEEYRYEGTLLVHARARGAAWTTFDYDGDDHLARCVRMRHEDGRERTLTHGARWVAVATSGGSTVSYQRDARFRPRRVVLADGTSTELQYDPSGALSSLRCTAGEWRWERDPGGAVTRVEGPAGLEVRITRDGAGRIVQRDQGARSTHLRYDVQGRLAEIAGPRPLRLEWRGALPAALGRGETELTFVYGRHDVLSHLGHRGARIVVQAGKLGEVVGLETTTEWVRRRREGDALVTRWRLPDGSARELARDASGRPVRLALGHRLLALAYDSHGQLVSLAEGTDEARITRNRDGSVARIDRAGRSLVLQRDVAGRIEELSDGSLVSRRPCRGPDGRVAPDVAEDPPPPASANEAPLPSRPVSALEDALRALRTLVDPEPTASLPPAHDADDAEGLWDRLAADLPHAWIASALARDPDEVARRWMLATEAVQPGAVPRSAIARAAWPEDPVAAIAEQHPVTELLSFARDLALLGSDIG